MKSLHILKYPTDNLKKFLNKVGKSSCEELTMKEQENLFFWLIENFFIGGVTIDELSGVSELLWSLSGDHRSNDRLSSLMLSTGNLAFLVRNITKDNIYAIEELKNTLSQLHEFHNTRMIELDHSH